MRLPLFSLALTGLLLAPAAAAKADTFNFSAVGSGGGFSGSGVFTASNNGDGSFTVSDIAGTNGTVVTGLIAPNGFFFNDNLLLPGATRQLSVDGIAFTAVAAGLTYSVNIFSTVSGYEAITLDADNDFTDTPVVFTLGNTAATPEPSSLLLLGSGLTLVAAGIRRRLAL